MKKKICITLCLLFPPWAGTMWADVTVVLLGPVNCARTASTPNVCTYAFTGVAGPGTLSLNSGTSGDSKDVSSAVVRLNGSEVVGPEAFSQRANTIIRPVTLAAANTLTVEMRGEPDIQLTLQVTAQVNAEGAALIGSDGGSVTVSDTSSPLYGVSLSFPAHAIEGGALVSIRAVPSPNVPLPAGAQPAGVAISLTSTTAITQPVLLEVPVAPRSDESDLRLLFYFNETSKAWDLVMPVASRSSNYLSVILDHFSTYQTAVASISKESIESGFSFDSDTLSADNSASSFSQWGCTYANGVSNTNGICAGMSFVAEAYFTSFANMYGQGLFSRYKPSTSFNLGCLAQGLYTQGSGSWVDKLRDRLLPLGQLLTPDFRGFVDALKTRLAAGQPTTVAMYDPFDLAEGHAVLVTAWRKTGTFSGAFRVYDNQDHTKRNQEITYWSVGITDMSYTDVAGNRYDWFVEVPPPAGVWQLIQDTPPDNVTPACPYAGTVTTHVPIMPSQGGVYTFQVEGTFGDSTTLCTVTPSITWDSGGGGWMTVAPLRFQGTARYGTGGVGTIFSIWNVSITLTPTLVARSATIRFAPAAFQPNGQMFQTNPTLTITENAPAANVLMK